VSTHSLGEGGLGKTTLACRFALWALAENPTDRLCPDRQMLPVIIEPAGGFNVQKDVTAFNRLIRGHLENTIGLPDCVPEPLFERLARTRRILVVLDGLSEMDVNSTGPQDECASPVNPDFFVRALVVTSRREEPLSQAAHADLYPLRIDRTHLSQFVTAYLREAGFDLDDAELFDACRRLARMANSERGITPLLAKLYAVQIVGALQDGAKKLEELPKTIPDLMLEYLNHLNRHRTADEPDDPSVHYATKLVAWECMRHSLRPGQAKIADVLARFKEAAPLAAAKPLSLATLSYLEENLRLISIVSPAKTHVQFGLDPLAEYIAAMHLVDIYGASEQGWRGFLATTEKIPGAPNSIGEFLWALRDCFDTKRGEHRVPISVVTQIAELSNRGRNDLSGLS
jgi:hypothetical protein